MQNKKLLDSSSLFILYGVLNLLLIFALLALLILLFNDIYILSRTGFVAFVGVHLFLLFFIKIQYLCLFYDEEKQVIEFHYNKRFGLNWRKKSRTVLLPLKQLDGYNISKGSMGIAVISFFKLEQKERYELGPFYIGYISNEVKQKLKYAFGESL
jgi:hypothetical protein